MTPLFALWLALLPAPATTPAIPPPSEPAAAQPAQQPEPVAPARPSIPSPSTSTALKGSAGVIPPIVLYQPEPQFTKIAKKQKVSGIATVSLIVDTLGNPLNVHIVKSIADTIDKNKKEQAAAVSLDQAAVDTVKQYKFKPAMMNGNPVAVYLNVQVDFQIY